VEQALGRADRVGGVDDHHVHAAGRAVGHVGHAVVEQQLGARVGIGFAQLREVLLGHARDLLVDVALGRAGHARVLEHLAQGAAVAAADDHHPLRLRMGEQRRVADHLVVQEVVAAGEHHRAVDQHQVAPVGGPVDLDLLERRLHLVELGLDPVADGRTGRPEMLDVPVVLGAHGGPRGAGGRRPRRRWRGPWGKGAHCNGAGAAAALECASFSRAEPRPMSDWSVDRARATWSIPYWSDGYFDVADGAMQVLPRGPGGPRLALPRLVEDARARGMKLPLLLRFPDILGDRLGRLQDAFATAMAETGYRGGYTAVYPIKVNQHRGVAGTLAAHAGEGFGLEAGSKPELMAVLALSRPGGLVVCNGYKDREYIRLALIGRKLGLETFIVIEKPSELRLVMEEARALGVEPGLGVRMRLASLGAGKWQNSGGDKAKFGLSPRQVLDLWKTLRDTGMSGCLQLLHFHMGSQISNVRDIANGMREAVRYFSE